MTDHNSPAPDDRTPEVIAHLRSTRVAEPTFKISVSETVDAARRARKIRSGRTAILGVAASLVAILAAVAVGSQPSAAPPDVVVASPGDGQPPSASPPPGFKVKKTLPVPPRESIAPPCPSSSSGDYVESLHRAADRITQAGRSSRYVDTFTGLAICDSLNRVAVFRIENAEFDRAMEEIGASDGAEVTFVDAGISYGEMLRITEEIQSRKSELRANGAPLDAISRNREGYVIAKISGDVDAARRILADLSDNVEVEFTPPFGRT